MEKIVRVTEKTHQNASLLAALGFHVHFRKMFKKNQIKALFVSQQQNEYPEFLKNSSIVSFLKKKGYKVNVSNRDYSNQLV